MKPCFLTVLTVLAALGTAEAEPVVLVNTLADRPVFSLVSAGQTLTLGVEPGRKITLEPGSFSGLGEKRVSLQGGKTYYLARFTALPGLYVLGPGQVLVLNQSGRALGVTVDGAEPASGVMAAGALALGALGPDGQFGLEWEDGPGTVRESVRSSGVYRLVRAGSGDSVSLEPWE